MVALVCSHDTCFRLEKVVVAVVMAALRRRVRPFLLDAGRISRAFPSLTGQEGDWFDLGLDFDLEFRVRV